MATIMFMLPHDEAYYSVRLFSRLDDRVTLATPDDWQPIGSEAEDRSRSPTR